MEAGPREEIVQSAASVVTSEYDFATDLMEQFYVPRGVVFAVGCCVRREDIKIEFGTRCPHVLVSVVR